MQEKPFLAVDRDYMEAYLWSACCEVLLLMFIVKEKECCCTLRLLLLQGPTGEGGPDGERGPPGNPVSSLSFSIYTLQQN